MIHQPSSYQKATQTQPLWIKALAEPGQEFGPIDLRLLSGEVPVGLRGTLYRNGPGRLERGGERVPHWFDGDGAILAVHLMDAGAIGLYRYIQTTGFQAESQSGEYLYSGYGQLAPGPFWQRWGKPTKNTANTSVIALPDKLLALWEGGSPHALDLETLETIGIDNLGALANNQPFSAHPKRAPEAGDIYNFGVTYGKTAKLNLFRCDSTGQIQQVGEVPLPRLSLVHDVCLAGPYLVFFVPPLQLQALPLLLGFRSYSDALQWQPDQGTQIIVVDRQTLQEVSRYDTDPWFQWHFGNGYVDQDGSVVVDYIRYPDFQINQWLAEVPTGHPLASTPGKLWRLRLVPETGKVLENTQQWELDCDFPIGPALQGGTKPNRLYLAADADASWAEKTAEMYNSIACLDFQTGGVSLAQPGLGCYPSEPIYAPDRFTPNQGWILTVVFDGNRDRSTLQIYNAQQLDAGPVAVLELPQIIPISFHGTWRPGN